MYLTENKFPMHINPGTNPQDFENSITNSPFPSPLRPLLLLLLLWKHRSLSRPMAKARAHASKRTTHHLLLAVSLSVSVLLPLLLPAAATAAVAVVEGDGGIKSALGAGRQWATGKDEVNLVAERDTAGGGLVEEDEFAGGFGSLDSMLQWAIGTGIPNPLNSAVRSFDFLWEFKVLHEKVGPVDN